MLKKNLGLRFLKYVANWQEVNDTGKISQLWYPETSRAGCEKKWGNNHTSIISNSQSFACTVRSWWWLMVCAILRSYVRNQILEPDEYSHTGGDERFRQQLQMDTVATLLQSPTVNAMSRNFSALTKPHSLLTCSQKPKQCRIFRTSINAVWIRKTNYMSLFVFFISLLMVAQNRSNKTPTWCNAVQVLFLQSHSTCSGASAHHQEF